MFGYTAFCCTTIVIAAAVGFAGAAAFSLLRRDRKTSILSGVGLFILVLCGIWDYTFVYLPTDFDRYPGEWDYYRLPLDYPYELSMIDVIDCARIIKWKEDISRYLVDDVSHYYKRDNLVVGMISEDCPFVEVTEWFSFDTQAGRAERYQTEEDFRQALVEYGLDRDLELPTVRENWDAYW